MVRVKTNGATQKRKKKVLKQAKGQFGHRSKRYRQAIRSVNKGLTYQYRDRKVKKREFRRLWIVRIGAACKELGMLYSRFINGLLLAKVEVDRKMLAEMAVHSPDTFKKFVEIAKDAQKAQKAQKTAPAKTETEKK